MTKSRAKKTFLVSVLALILCVATLVGTTFAWFSDSVTSKDNLIQAGTLKIDLLHGTTSLKNNLDHKVFDYGNWEPGYTAAEPFTLMNYGTLNFK